MLTIKKGQNVELFQFLLFKNMKEKGLKVKIIL